jgi:bifunctional oligoribonuclease and PAP phosphatase NrnA
VFDKAWSLIDSANNILIMMHQRPDGDALGSALGLLHTLVLLKKRAVVANLTTPLSHELSFLPGFEKVRTSMSAKFDLLITVDSATLDLVGIERPNVPILNIDHHQSSTMFGDVNIVLPKKASAAEVVMDFLMSRAIKLNRPASICFYTALCSDTQNFTISRVTHSTFDTAGVLMDSGAEPADIAKSLNRHKGLNKMRLHGKCLSEMALSHSGRVVSVLIPLSWQEETGATLREADEIADIMLSLATVEMSFMLIQTQSGAVKGSLRSEGDIDVSKIASQFDGGGHHNAAGLFAKKASLEEVHKKIVSLLDEEIQ